MRAVRLAVHNFRSILDADVELERYSLVLGANNSGKSNLLAAIRVFYEKDLKFEEQRDFPKVATTDQESWVEIEYQCTPTEVAELKDEYKLPGDRFRVRKYFQSAEKDEEGKDRQGIYAYVNGALSGTRFYGAKNVQQGKLGTVIFIPAASKLDEHTKLSGPSALRDLLSSVLKGVLATSGSYKALADAFSAFGTSVRTEESHPGWSLAQVESSISKEIEDWGLSFELEISPLDPDEILKSLVGHRINDCALGTALSSSAFGQGFQRHLIFVLIRLASSYSPPSAAKSKKEFAPELEWLLFEEPEAFLHPTQIALLDEHLRAYAASDGRQVLICTHSPIFASRAMEDIPSLLRLNREGAHSLVSQIRAADVPTMLAANQACVASLTAVGVDTSTEDATVEMEAVKYALWLNPLRAQLFFAERVLLVEGPTEYALFSFLMARGDLVTPKRGISIVDTLGKWNTHRFINILSALRIPHSVLIDQDGSTPKSTALQAAISTAATSFTRQVDSFPADLESFLGVPASKRPDRKPQHLMWHLASGKIDSGRLSALIAKVQPLLDV
ncbi:MAG: AAA family ATPase [Gemmatimonadaceae bacterium]|nr:AAA family ATPase [Gemmatimonadaceae bacterium]